MTKSIHYNIAANSKEGRRMRSKASKSYWARFTPEERSIMLRERANKAWSNPNSRANHKAAQIKMWAEMPSDIKLARLRKRSIPGVKAAMAKKSSSIEEAICLILNKTNVEYVRQYQVSNCVCDIFIPKSDLIIECDGCYWHGCNECGFVGRSYTPESQQRRDNVMRENGYKVIHIKECAIVESPENALLNALRTIK